MNLEYRYSESTVKPEELEIGKTTVYFRKDIKTEERTFDDFTQTFYVYQEAKMPLEEFKKRANNQVFINAMKGADTADNQMIIMEAIADLYEAVAALQGGMSK